MSQDESKVAAGASGQAATPEWTIMVYFAGDNSLSAQCIAIMQELEALDVDDNVRVLACFDSNTPLPKGSRYLEIKRGRRRRPTELEWGLHNDLVTPDERGHENFAPDFCNPNPSSVLQVKEPVAGEGLARFLDWAMKTHRARRHILVLFGHGTAVAGQTFLVDNNPPSFLRLEELSKILGKHFGGKDEGGKNRPRLDILACNNCVMNGIETAYEVRNAAEYMIGSQGLMLAVGWPYNRIYEAVRNNAANGSDFVAGEILKVCARNMLDFSLMDRSLDQSACNLTKFGEDGDIIPEVKALAVALQGGLLIDDGGNVVYPMVRDIIRLARLEAQSFWDETFVDLYDFCELLMQRCLQAVEDQKRLLGGLPSDAKNAALEHLEGLDEVKQLRGIAKSCLALLGEFKGAVPLSYFIGSELQYSHGLSIYFPWTLPEGPHIYEPVKVRGAEHEEPKEFTLHTPFDIYKKYDFAAASGWSDFLTSFFRATLRDVRTSDKIYKQTDGSVNFDGTPADDENAFPVTLQKSSSDISSEGASVGIKIKNYPRRNYLSPADCRRKKDGKPAVGEIRQFSRDKEVSYLGWNIRGLVAEVVKPPVAGAGSAPAGNKEGGSAAPPAAPPEGSETGPQS